ncbi:MAG: hypothetical protein KAS93_08000 [Gammaproteobacteria bacterium]|nr:hypothetical protein [Gammaproteobacteria bacterium]
MNGKKTTGTTLAIAAAAMFAAAPMSVMAAGDKGSSEAKVHCYGVNKCKGHNDCKTDKNACKGHASCKGHGFISMSQHACDETGGKVGK